MSSSQGSFYGSFHFEVLEATDDLATGEAFSAPVDRLALSPFIKAPGTAIDVHGGPDCDATGEEGGAGGEVEGEAGAEGTGAAGAGVRRHLACTSVQATKRVIVGVTSKLLESKFGEPGRYKAPTHVFRYDMQVNNARTTDVKVLKHSWVFVDEADEMEMLEGADRGGGGGTSPVELLQISGEGLGGDHKLDPSKSVIRSGAALRIMGTVTLPARHAVAYGFLTVESGREVFTVQIEKLRFSLECESSK